MKLVSPGVTVTWLLLFTIASCYASMGNNRLTAMILLSAAAKLKKMYKIMWWQITERWQMPTHAPSTQITQ